MKRRSSQLYKYIHKNTYHPISFGGLQVLIYISLLLGSYSIALLEMIISFLPVLLTASMIDIGRIAYGHIKQSKRPSKKVPNPIFRWLHRYRYHTLAVYSIIVSVLFGYVAIFAYYNPPHHDKSLAKEPMRIVWFNKYYKNDNYRAISNRITELDPDVVGMTEVAAKEVDKLNLKKRYPYVMSNPHRYKRLGFGIVFFSKYPIIDSSLTTKIPENPTIKTPNEYVMEAQIDHQGSIYHVIVAHLDTPLNNTKLELRNNMLRYIKTRLRALPPDRTLLMGDFNTTPWTPLFHETITSTSHLAHVARGKGIHSTFGVFPLQVHIDHIFVPTGSRIRRYVVDEKMGSDHHLIWADIHLIDSNRTKE